jgi:hypothetical protein
MTASWRCSNDLHAGRTGGCDGWALFYGGHEIQPADVELVRLAGWTFSPCDYPCHGPPPDFPPSASLQGAVQ